MKISHKVMLNNSIILLLVVLTAAVSVLGVQKLDATLTSMSAVHLQSVSLVLDLNVNMHQAMIHERAMLSADPATAKAEDLERREEFRAAGLAWDRYKTVALTEEEKSLLPAYEQAVKKWEEQSNQVAAIVLSGSSDARERATAVSFGQSEEAFKAMGDILAAMTKAATKAAAATRQTGSDARARALREIFLCTVLALLGGMGVTAVMTKLVVSTVQKLTAALRNAAEGDGDLTVVLDDSSKDEMGEVAKWFNTFVAKVADTVRVVGEIAAHMASTSENLSRSAEESTRVTSQIAEAIQQIAAGSQDQSESAGKTAVAVDQLNTAITRVAHGTQGQTEGVHKAMSVATQSDECLRAALGMLEETREAAKRNAAFAVQGTEAVEKVLLSMDSIKETTDHVTNSISELDGYSQEIGKIVEVISGIAAQTNLLALNAAIEAARAGEHGRGFAVVSEEVRKLAEDSARETKAIGALVNSIRQAMQKAVATATSGVKEVENGSVLAREASLALKHISDGAAETERLTRDLSQAAKQVGEASQSVQNTLGTIVELAEGNAAAADEMTVSAEEVRKLIDSVAAISEESAASTEEVSASAEEMSNSIREVSESATALAELAAKLRNTVSRFRVN